MTLDELVPQIDKIRIEGAIVLLKWDGARTENPCTVIVTRHDTDYIWRKDSDTIEGILEEALSAYSTRAD